jgi:glycosyltransferase involved in cell wall biosynthesis
MKLLHVMAGAAGGGAETAFAELCAAQAASGNTVYAACRPSYRNDILRKSGARVVEMPFGGVFDFKTRPALKKLIKTAEPDVIVSWMNRAAKKMPRNPGAPWIARLGGYYDLKYYKHVDRFVVNAPDIGRWMEDHGVAASRITFIPNFAEIDVNAKPIDRASLDTTEDAFVFLALSRLHTNKAIDTLLHAFAQVPDAVLWLGGDGPERKNLEKLAGDLGIASRVRFLGWREDRWALLAACDAFVLPSRHEPFGNSFMQAWAAEKPLVSTASQGPSHYIRNGVDALMTPVDDVPALARALNQVRTDKPLREKLAAEGHAHYMQAFDKQAILAQWQTLFKQAKE